MEITLVSMDGKHLKVDKVVALESKVLKLMIEDSEEETMIIPLPNVTGNALLKIIEYSEHSVQARKANQASDEIIWNQELMNIDEKTLFELVMASHYLDMDKLLHLSCIAVANMIKDLCPEDIRSLFKIDNDFSPTEEEEIRRQDPWAYEALNRSS